MTNRKVLLAGIALLAFQAEFSSAQESRASLGGIVADTTGAAVRGAVVKVTSVETGVTRTAKTDKSGAWSVNFLIPGHYSFVVDSPNFKELEHSAIELQVSDQKLIDSRLEIGAQTETVSVTSEPLIDPTSAISGTVITGEELLETPNQSNVPTLLAGLAPGVQVTQQKSPARLYSNAAGSAISAGNSGASNSNVNYTLDGGNDTIGNGQVAFIPPTDAVAEFRVSINAYDASIGRTSGPTINLVSKSGTDHYHGDVYEFNQNNLLNANSSLNHKKGVNIVPAYHYNEFGIVAGGPISIPLLYNGRVKHSYVFFSYDGIRLTQPLQTGASSTGSVPTLAERNGDYSQSYAVVNGTKYAARIYDPLTYNPVTGLRQQFPNNIIPESRMDPVAKVVYALLPAPNNPSDGQNTDSNNFLRNQPARDQFNTYGARLDQNWNSNNVSYANLRYNNLLEDAYNPFGTGNPLQGSNLKRINKGLTLDDTLTLSQKFVLDLRYNLTRYEATGFAGGTGIDPTSLGFNPTLAALSQLPSVPYFTSVAGVANSGLVSNLELSGLGTNQAGTYTYDTTNEAQVNISQILARHDLHYGFQYVQRQEALGSLGASSGSFGFGPNFTTQNPDAAAGTGEGSPTASFFLGLPTTGSIPNAATSFFSTPYYAGFVQDNWRVNGRLTLNVGLRYDIEVPAVERNNSYFTRYDTSFVQTGITAASQPRYAALVGGATTNLGARLLQQFRPDPSTFVVRGGIRYAGLDGVSRKLYNTRYKYFQPRLGFGYKVHSDLVLRGGLGRFVEAEFIPANYANGNYQPGYSSSTPFIPTTDNFHNIANTLDNPFPSGKVALTGNSLGPLTNPGYGGIFPDTNYGRPYTDEASVYLDQQVRDYLFEIGGTLNITHGRSVGGVSINVPGQAQFLAAFNPQFDANGRPVDTLPGDVQVANPFLRAPNITSGVQNNATIDAFDLLRPLPLNAQISIDKQIGKRIYYAMNTKVEKRFHNGFSVLNAFTWSKAIREDNTIGPQDYAFKIERRLSDGDVRFIESLAPIYDLPFGRGRRFAPHLNRAVDEVIGGWQATGVYLFESGTPISLPTNSAFFSGQDPTSSPDSQSGLYINPAAFAPFPVKNTSSADVHNSTIYPAFTGIQSLPGYNYNPSSPADTARNGVYQDFRSRVTYNQTTFGDVRQPYYQRLDLGVRKNFPIREAIRVELRLDAYNALNHPIYSGVSTTVGSAFFGRVGGTSFNNVDQSNQPRAIQLSGRIFF